jgi:hypothetical protein
MYLCLLIRTTLTIGVAVGIATHPETIDANVKRVRALAIDIK